MIKLSVILQDENCLEDLGSTAESDYNFKEVIRFEETVEKESIKNNDTKEEYKEDDFWAVITADTGEKHNGPQALIDTENLSLIETGETYTDNLKIPCTSNFEEFTMIDNDQPENDESFEAISGIAYLLGEDNADCQPIATEGERENGYNDSSATSENEEVDFWAKLKDDDDCTYHLEPEKDALSNSFELNSSSDFVEEKDNVEDIPKKDEGGILKKDTEEENPIKQAQSEEDFWAKLTEQPVETSVSEDSLSLLPSDKLPYSDFLCGNDSLVTDMCTDFASEEIEDIDILDYLDGAIIWKMNEEATLTSNAFQSDHHVELDDLDFMDGVMIWEESTEIQDCKMQPGEINQFELVRRTSPDVDEPLLYNIESKELQDIQMCSVEDNLVKEEIEWRSFSPTSKETNDISDKIFASPEEEEKQHIEHSSVKNISTSRFPKCSRIPKPKKRSQHQNLELTDTTTSNISVDVMDLDCKGSKRRDQARDRDRDRDRRNRKSGRGSQF